MIKSILIDDEVHNLEALAEKLSRSTPQVDIVATCTNAEEGIRAISISRPDLVFLDIEMPVMNGFRMLQQLHYRQFEVIFVTAYDHYAIKAIKYSALDYLIKPVDTDELKAAVARAEERLGNRSRNLQIELLLEQLPSRSPQRIALPTLDGLLFIPVADIIYLDANGNYTNIFLNNKHYLVSRSLREYEEILPPDIFLRIHHSHLINKNEVERYIRGDGGQVVMSNGVTLDVSKRRKAAFLQAIASHIPGR